MERIDLYNEDGTVALSGHLRGDPLPEGLWLMAVGIWLMDDKGRLLMTKRSPEKKFAPNLWENTGGHVQSGEKCEDAIIRELREETGIEVSPQDIVLLGEAKNFPYLGRTYGVRKNFALSAIRLQEGETCDAKAVTADEFVQMVSAGALAPSVVSHMEGYKENFWNFVSGRPIL